MTRWALMALCALTLAGCASRRSRTTEGPRTTSNETARYSPEISHSRGVAGGIVLLWPRVVPMADTAKLRGPAKALQERLAAMLSERYPGREIDVRPEPERVCPRLGGCTASSVGVLIGTKFGECVAVLLVSAPGESPQRLTPWVGALAKKPSVPFRDPPESSVTLAEMVSCDRLALVATERDAAIKAALEL